MQKHVFKKNQKNVFRFFLNPINSLNKQKLVMTSLVLPTYNYLYYYYIETWDQSNVHLLKQNIYIFLLN